MSQTGKLYRFYFGKIWQKNWLRILVFTILIGVVWWFVIPFIGSKGVAKFLSSNLDQTAEQRRNIEKNVSFSNTVKLLFGSKIEIKGIGLDVGLVEARLKLRDELQKDRKRKEEGQSEEEGNEGLSAAQKIIGQAIDSFNIFGLSFPFTADNVFFFQHTDGSVLGYADQNYTKGKTFWKLLFDIAWWNLTGFVVLYWFTFEIFERTFFSPREDGEEATVLTMTPGVKRGDLIWGKILAFLTFYFLINIVFFLIPYGIYYFWLSPVKSWSSFSLLALISVIVLPLLFFFLVFVPYLFVSSWLGRSKWIFSTLIVFLPALWWALKMFSSWTWPYKVENVFFDPIWFTIISLVCGIFFLTLYYLRYQEEDLN
ncbi:hypothetical protein [endosymbiont DhMRE of Dentiscutata heterogama]|uniref:hypothetical protein n=1 Tax=endosymbiont DhMRE of Dentiscutata heterogama TaxID=1609546 RepID=UPI002AD40A27|nr:hypothetical protein [endosymbiont DhMRE of Dentiscutata heterogama]